MKTVKIPSNYRPWVCNINGVVYQYEAGTTQEVPDEVAALIESNENLAPKEAPEAGKEGQVWTKESKGADWNDLPPQEKELPSGGNKDDVLTKTESGVEWKALPPQEKELPSVGNKDDVLTKTESGVEWKAPSGVFVVNVGKEGSTSSYTIDKTNAEILAAYQAGKTVVCNMVNYNGCGTPSIYLSGDQLNISWMEWNHNVTETSGRLILYLLNRRGTGTPQLNTKYIGYSN